MEQVGKSLSAGWMYILFLILELTPSAVLTLRYKTSASPPRFSNLLEKQRWDSVQDGTRQSVEGKGMSPSLSLLAHACHHSNGPGLMSEATTGRPPLKGISAEGLLAGKGPGVKF